MGSMPSVAPYLQSFPAGGGIIRFKIPQSPDLLRNRSRSRPDNGVSFIPVAGAASGLLPLRLTLSSMATDFSRTKRVVFLIDLDPLLRLQNGDRYLSSIVSSAKTLLSFPPLSSSLFSFKPFFSSLSPILSSSKLPSSSLYLSFNDPPTTLRNLTRSLRSLPKFADSPTTNCPCRASNVAASLRQVLHDYSWDSIVDDDAALGNSSPCHSAVRPPSNLVVLFSLIGRTREWASRFIGADMEDRPLTCMEQFNSEFRGVFQNVNGSFVGRGIHCSWVDVKYAPECTELEGSEHVVSGIRSLGWGFCSTQSIVFGPVIVPFGLIYPSISLPPKFFGFSGDGNRVRTNLRLEIAGIDGKPLECKLCKLQLANMKVPVDPFLSVEDFHVKAQEGSGAWMEQFMGGTMKVEALQKHAKFATLKERSSEMILVREYSGRSEEGQKGDRGREFFADELLQLMASEMGMALRNSPPLWQIFLSFMCREGYWALVSLSKLNGDRCFGVLEPLSLYSAVISLTDEKSDLDDMVKFIRKAGNQICGSTVGGLVDKNESNSRPVEPLVSTRQDKFVPTKSKKNHRSLRLLQDLSWSEFQEKDLEGLDVGIDQLYFARESEKSRELKFLKCWVKEVKRYTSSEMSIENASQPKAPEETENAAAEAHQVSEQPIPASDPLSAASRVQGDVALDCGIEGSEDVLNDIPNKICKGLESKEVDLGTLAQRLVNSSIYCIYQRPEMKVTSEGELPSGDADNDCLSKVASQVSDLLLREPKDLSESNKCRDPSSQTLDRDASSYAVREYELQILFRMEILRSEISAAIKDSVKKKFVKQICSLLEYIQCQLQGFFDDWSLHNYVGKIIKSRYSEDLEEVVHQIYLKMDLLLFDEEDEMPNSLLNSEEESGQSWRNQTAESQGGMGKNGANDQRMSAEGESQALPPPRKSHIRKKEEQEQRLIKARERRERARRVASYTSWVPDLQRVWAPKQQANPTQAKPEPFAKQPKRKDERSARRDVVCETPMTVNKRSCLQRNGSPDQDSSMNRSGSVPKSLFQSE